MKKLVIAFIALSAISNSAFAINKCNINGKISYQQAACPHATLEEMELHDSNFGVDVEAKMREVNAMARNRENRINKAAAFNYYQTQKNIGYANTRSADRNADRKQRFGDQRRDLQLRQKRNLFR